MKNKKNTKFLLKNTNFIDKNVNFGRSCVFGPNVFITEKTEIKNNCTINLSTIKNSVIKNDCEIIGSILENCTVEDGCSILNSVLKNCVIKRNTTVGPFAYVREGSVIGEKCRVGDFVEIKNSTIKNGTKCAHLCYVGDAFIGENCNIGCGCVFANYDGKQKHKTVVGDNCFLGANVNLVAPVSLGNNCFIAAGSTIRKNLKDNTFLIDLNEQKISKNKNSTN